jgi:hypothetical protein
MKKIIEKKTKLKWKQRLFDQISKFGQVDDSPGYRNGAKYSTNNSFMKVFRYPQRAMTEIKNYKRSAKVLHEYGDKLTAVMLDYGYALHGRHFVYFIVLEKLTPIKHHMKMTMNDCVCLFNAGLKLAYLMDKYDIRSDDYNCGIFLRTRDFKTMFLTDLETMKIPKKPQNKHPHIDKGNIVDMSKCWILNIYPKEITLGGYKPKRLQNYLLASTAKLLGDPDKCNPDEGPFYWWWVNRKLDELLKLIDKYENMKILHGDDPLEPDDDIDWDSSGSDFDDYKSSESDNSD